MQTSFQGFDIYKPRKPKGLASLALEEWKKHYPNSEETNKTIGFKLAKYDRGPDSEKVKISPSGRIVWSPQMLQKLQEARQIAQRTSARSGISLNKAWQTEFKKSYPDLNVDWKSVLSRYNYHFGNLDTIGNAQLRDQGSDSNHADLSKESLNKDTIENGNTKVKGFRNWTQPMEQDLIETGGKVIKNDPSLEKGSSAFNRVLLKEFLKLYPKCMESSRSLYSKLQSIEKDEAKVINSPIRSNSIEEKVTPAPQVTPEPLNVSKSEDEPIKIKEEPRDSFITAPTNISQDQNEVPFPPSQIEGFEEWNLPMIRDFIGKFSEFTSKLHC